MWNTLCFDALCVDDESLFVQSDIALLRVGYRAKHIVSKRNSGRINSTTAKDR